MFKLWRSTRLPPLPYIIYGRIRIGIIAIFLFLFSLYLMLGYATNLLGLATFMVAFLIIPHIASRQITNMLLKGAGRFWYGTRNKR